MKGWGGFCRRALVAGVIGVCLLSLPAFAQNDSSRPNANTPNLPRIVDLGRSAFASVPSGLIIIGPEDAACAPQYEGALRYSVKHKTLLLCDGKQWNAVMLEPVDR